MTKLPEKLKEDEEALVWNNYCNWVDVGSKINSLIDYLSEHEKQCNNRVTKSDNVITDQYDTRQEAQAVKEHIEKALEFYEKYGSKNMEYIEALADYNWDKAMNPIVLKQHSFTEDTIRNEGWKKELYNYMQENYTSNVLDLDLEDMVSKWISQARQDERKKMFTNIDQQHASNFTRWVRETNPTVKEQQAYIKAWDDLKLEQL